MPEPPSPETWQTLFSLDKRPADDRQVLTRQLGLWCAHRGIAGAAVYATVDSGPELQTVKPASVPGFDRIASVGEPPGDDDGWPERIDEGGAAVAPSAAERFELPGILLLHTPPTRAVDAGDADLLLLLAGARLSALKQQIQEQSFQAKFRGVELEALYDVGLAIASTLDLEELCEEALLRAVSLLDARRGALYLFDGARYVLTSRFGGEAVAEVPGTAVDSEEVSTGAVRTVRDWLPGARHVLSVPVEIEGNPRGLLMVADKESRRGVGPFPSTDRRTLSLFANQAAIALENAKLHKLALEKERLEREMELAAEIQMQLLPKAMPEIPGFEVVGWNRPARQVGGDYYDLPGLGSGRWGLVVGDVTGKGLPAALLVSTLHSALRLLLDRMEVGPGLIERLNRHIFESSSANKFITLLLATVDTQDGHLAYLNAGHNPGLVVRADGTTVQLDSAGLPLGLLPDRQYRADDLDLEVGDLVCLYSDGITECESPEEEEYGMERLVDLLREHRNEPLAHIIQTIDKATIDFACELPQGDDQTVVLLRRTA